MELASNPELERAYAYVCQTNQSVFLTGKAGTGKTTFLRRLQEQPVKRMVIVAPTGVAAINAGGMTIHSFFQLPFGPYVPGHSRDAYRQRRFSGEKIKLIRSLELLVIDEISMVRADLLDGVDEVLRRYKNPFRPFGGVQLLLIGDLHQLPPVVKDEEWTMLKSIYPSPYFFHSRALQQAQHITIELKHIYRQSDAHFIELLNRVRENRLDAEVMATLNSRYIPDFKPAEEEGYITLSTHNATANAINARKLGQLEGEALLFEAKISGEFPESFFPTDPELELKIGAQVMFVRNDPDAGKRFYNGKIGKITRIREEIIYVQCPGDPWEIDVLPLEWENVRYSLNEQNGEVQEEIIGTFTQYPLRLAWAITIHKSQGLTFEKVLLDAEAAFAHGQVYVALSRCKSFEGLVLHSRIYNDCIKTDVRVQQFTREAEANQPGDEHLQRSRIEYQQQLLFDLFGFATFKKALEQLSRAVLENERSLQPGAGQKIQDFARLNEEKLFSVSLKFLSQLRRLFPPGELPDQSEALQDRVSKAAAWFGDQLANEVGPALKNLRFLSDNRAVRTAVFSALENLDKELFIKSACFVSAKEGFQTQKYLRAAAQAELDFSRRGASQEDKDASEDMPHPELYSRMNTWRKKKAKEKSIQPYEVISTQSMLEIVRKLPQRKSELKAVKGLGSGRMRQFGEGLLELILKYQLDKGLIDQAFIDVQKKPKIDSRALSLELFRAGKSLEEIAAERGLVRGTIEGHLTHFIGQGKLQVSELLPAEKIAVIEQCLTDSAFTTLSEARIQLGEEYSYNEIRMVLEHLRAAGRLEASQKD